MSEFKDLSEEAQDVAKGMIEYCISNRIRMGMDEGEDIHTGKEHSFLIELREFVEIY